MAHFAKINDNNMVEEVLVIDNSLQSRGNDFLANELNLGGKWIQTSYNNKFRKQFAGVGYFYDEINDVFISPQPFPSWTLNENFDWEAPIPRPEGINWYWHEDSHSWIGQSS